MNSKLNSVSVPHFDFFLDYVPQSETIYSAKNISEFEERSMENTIEYLKLRLERIKRTFETEKYQEIMNLEIGETEILQTKDHNYLRDWTVPAELPLNWDESLKPNYNRIIMNPKKRQAKFGFSA